MVVVVVVQLLSAPINRTATGNESVPKIIINDTKSLFFLNCNPHFGKFKP